jgi:hypothetical protein
MDGRIFLSLSRQGLQDIVKRVKQMTERRRRYVSL